MVDKSLFEQLAPTPPALEDVVTRLESHLTQEGFVRIAAPPCGALFSLQCQVDQEEHGKLLLLAVSYAQHDEPRTKGKQQKGKAIAAAAEPAGDE
jgi:hypothetical protein